MWKNGPKMMYTLSTYQSKKGVEEENWEYEEED